MATSLTNIFGSNAATSSPSGTTAGKVSGQEGTLSSWAAPYVTSMLGKAEALTEQPYQAYQGPLTAGPSSLQQQYFSGLEKIGFPGQLGQSFTSTGAPTIPTASTTGPSQATAAASGIAGQYMNPYLQNVLQPQLEEMRRQAQIQQMQNASRMAKAGAFGGGRQAIMDAELQRNLMTQMGSTIGQGYASAYDKAMDQFNREQAQASGLAQMLERGGAAQRAIEAEGIAADLGEFQQQRDYPYKQLQFQQSMLQNMPLMAQNVSYQEDSPFVKLLNAAGGLEALYKVMFPNTPAQAPAPAPAPAPKP
jgi:hypothetical protein